MPRVFNDFGKRCHLQTAVDLISSYLYAREYGLNSKLSAKYSILTRERQKFHSGWINIEKESWKHLTRIESGKKRFLSLINSPLNTTLTFSDLEKLRKRVKISKSYTSRSEDVKIGTFLIKRNRIKGRRLIEHQKAMNNYITIIGGKRTQRLTFFMFSFTSVKRNWLKYRRARDLFFFGKFNINEVLERIGIEPRQIINDPFEISAQAYGAPYYAIKEIVKRDQPLYEYLKRYIKEVRDNNLLPRLDEFILPTYIVDGEITQQQINNMLNTLRPTQLLARFQTIREQYWDNRKIKKPEIQEEWPWTKEVFPDMETQIGTMRAINTNAELTSIATKMHNCAENYCYDIQSKRYLFIYLTNNDEIIALGQYNKSGKLEQVLGPCNKKVSKEVNKVFKSINPTF